MPTYEYECEKCGHKFEAFQAITAPPIERCAKCAGSVRRLISAGSGIIFKGQGFYQTDYKNKQKASSCPLDNNKPACESCSAPKEA